MCQCVSLFAVLCLSVAPNRKKKFNGSLKKFFWIYIKNINQNYFSTIIYIYIYSHIALNHINFREGQVFFYFISVTLWKVSVHVFDTIIITSDKIISNVNLTVFLYIDFKTLLIIISTDNWYCKWVNLCLAFVIQELTI